MSLLDRGWLTQSRKGISKLPKPFRGRSGTSLGQSKVNHWYNKVS